MILVTGASGMCGSYVRNVYFDGAIHLTDLDAMDIRDGDQVMRTFSSVRPDLVLHLAAETDVDRCEKEPDHARTTNVEGTGNVVAACLRYNAEMVYISTLGVFDGRKPTPYTEEDLPAPLSYYARTKWEGEQLDPPALRWCYIVRTGWIFGGGEKDKKFVGKIAALCQDGHSKELKVVDDKFGNPTYAQDLVAKIRELTVTGKYGLYHVANEGSCSRFEFAREITRLLGRNVPMVLVLSDAFPLPAPRPRSEAGESRRLVQIGLKPMRPWKVALNDYLGSWSGRP